MKILCVRLMNTDGERSVSSGDLMDALFRISPVIEYSGDGVIFVGIDGVESLHGGSDEILRLVFSSCERLNVKVSCGIGGRRFSSFIASSLVPWGEALTIPDGEDRAFLASQPIEFIPAPDEVITTLRLLGITTLGDLAAVDVPSLVLRFGEAATAWSTLARGGSELPLRAHLPHRPVSFIQWFETPLHHATPMVFLIEEGLNSIAGAMRALGRGVLGLLLRLHTDDGGHKDVTVRFHRPMTDPILIQEATRRVLEPVVLHEPCVAFELIVVDDSPLSRQGRLFPDRIDTSIVCDSSFDELIERLQGLVGSDSVGRFHPIAGHVPEDSSVLKPWNASPPPQPSVRSGVRPRSPLVPGGRGTALRLVSSPRAVSVRLDSNDVPFEVDGHRVVETAGPFPAIARWWQDTHREGAYYQILTAHGALIWMFQTARQWFVQGFFE